MVENTTQLNVSYHIILPKSVGKLLREDHYQKRNTKKFEI